MIIQISSGQGPVECEILVEKFFAELKREYPDICVIDRHQSRFSSYPTSIMFETEAEISELEGTVQWVCHSPVRKNHKRKNWFADVRVIPEEELICTNRDIRFEYFHCGGKGGQNVNKVETGVRAIHIPTGITTTSTRQRSQLLNKKDALEKINVMLAEMEMASKKEQIHLAWKAHNRIVRGNPVRTYQGMKFERVPNKEHSMVQEK